MHRRTILESVDNKINQISKQNKTLSYVAVISDINQMFVFFFVITCGGLFGSALSEVCPMNRMSLSKKKRDIKFLTFCPESDDSK